MTTLDKQHRQPAISYLEQGMSNSPYQSYTNALLQHYQGEDDQALTTLEQARDLPSWFYQHHILRGDIYLLKTQKAASTHNGAQVQSHSKLALMHYGEAAQQGRSNLQLQLKPLMVYSSLLNSSLYGKQQGFMTIYQQATAVLNNAITQFEQALLLAPNNTDILLVLGLAYSQKIKLLQERDLSVEHLFTAAVDIFNRIPKANRDYSFYNYYALLRHELAVSEAGRLAQKQTKTN
jgi:hypothetical protein